MQVVTNLSCKLLKHCGAGVPVMEVVMTTLWCNNQLTMVIAIASLTYSLDDVEQQHQSSDYIVLLCESAYIRCCHLFIISYY